MSGIIGSAGSKSGLIVKSTSARYHTGAYGSSNNRIFHFSSTQEASNNQVVTIATTSAAGMSITANMPCMCWITFGFTFTAADGTAGLTKNSNQLSTSIWALSDQNQNLGMQVTRASGQMIMISWAGKLVKNDVIRPHGDATAIHSTGQRTQIHILATTKT